MNIRLLPVAAIVATLPLIAGVAPAQARGQSAQIPAVLGFHRIDRHDRAFLTRASTLAVQGMQRAQSVVVSSRVPEVQAEAVRAFNTSAAAYNRLVDIAATFGMTLAAPRGVYSQKPQAPLDDTATVSQSDLAFVDAHQAALMQTIDVYRAEADHGSDPAAARFAQAFAPRLVHDLALATVDRKDLSSAATQ